MKKSVIVAFIIFLAVIGWFFTGQISIGDERTNSQTNTQNIEENNDNTDKKNNFLKVETQIVYAENIDQSITLQGQTIQNRTIDVKSETIGNIINKNFTRGKEVTSNEILLEISMEDRQELLNSNIKELEKINKEILINEQKRDNSIFKTKEQIKLYEIEYQSAKQLIDKGLSSKSKFSLASYNLTSAKSNLRDIELNYLSQVANLESQIANIKSKIKNIKIDIDNTKISSPFSGIINNSYVEIGDYVQPGNILFNVVDLNPIKIQGYLSESDINKVKIGTKAIIKNSNSIIKTGNISFISPTAETSTRTFEIIIEANNDDLLFKSGITASITIKGSTIKAHKIPPSILTLQDDGTVGVKAINEENIVVFYPIKKEIDTIDGMWVSGLPKEVRLIVTGQEYITKDQIVEID